MANRLHPINRAADPLPFASLRRTYDDGLQVVVRRAQPSDQEGVRNLINSLAGPGGLNAIGPEHTERWIREGTSVIATRGINGPVIGHLASDLLTPQQPDRHWGFEVRSLGVAEEYRNRELGRALAVAGLYFAGKFASNTGMPADSVDIYWHSGENAHGKMIAQSSLRLREIPVFDDNGRPTPMVMSMPESMANDATKRGPDSGYKLFGARYSQIRMDLIGLYANLRSNGWELWK